jgi:hypothetical protein
MPLEQYSYGIGSMWAVRTDVTTPTPVRFGVVQDVSVELSHTMKELIGQYQAPVAVARGGLKITGKCKSAKLNARAFNDAFFGQTLITGELVAVTDEGGSVGTAIPASPYELTVTHNTGFDEDKGVFFTATGVQLIHVTGTPTTGQYSVSAGVYTFAAADATKKVAISYTYTQTSSGGRVTAYNQLMGNAPVFKMTLGNSFLSKASAMVLYQCIATKLSFHMKNEDFEIPELDFAAFADSTGRYFDWSTDNV